MEKQLINKVVVITRQTIAVDQGFSMAIHVLENVS